MIRIQNMDAYRHDIQRLADRWYGKTTQVSEATRSASIKILARSIIDLDIQKQFYHLTDKEIDDAIREELFNYIKLLEREDEEEMKQCTLDRILASAHECSGGCVD